MNWLRNDTAHHFTPHHAITSSYRYRGIGITKSYSMIDKGVGGGIMVCIIDVLREVGENNCIMLKRIARGLGDVI